MAQTHPSPEQSAEEAAIRRVWRRRFQHEVPVADHTQMLRGILIENGVSEIDIDEAIRREFRDRGLTEPTG